MGLCLSPSHLGPQWLPLEPRVVTPPGETCRRGVWELGWPPYSFPWERLEGLKGTWKWRVRLLERVTGSWEGTAEGPLSPGLRGLTGPSALRVQGGKWFHFSWTFKFSLASYTGHFSCCGRAFLLTESHLRAFIFWRGWEPSWGWAGASLNEKEKPPPPPPRTRPEWGWS